MLSDSEARTADGAPPVGAAPRRIAILGNYVPRRCGIATFTTGLAEAMAAEAPKSEIAVLAMNDRGVTYDYPPRVCFELDADRLEDYYLAADFIHTSGFELLCVQHEYGIFGGTAGSHLLALLRQVRIPLVATLHTVLRQPSVPQRRVLAGLTELADRLVVMNPRSGELLAEVYGVPPDRIRLIHHGIPDVPLVDPDPYKAAIGAEGRKVILTFGLLSPGKGIEYMIEAMPAIVRAHGDVLYVVLGRTHPHVVRESGETYRTRLERLVRRLGVEGHVHFQNEFVGLSRLLEHLRAADLYVTPYLNPEQAVSGTLAYALGTGKPIISTPYSYAEVMLAEGRGRLVPLRDSGALARHAVELLSDDAARNAIRRAAYDFSRQMVWPEVARQHLALAEEVVEEHRRRPEPVVWAHSPEGRPLGLQEAAAHPAGPPAAGLPAVNLDHLRALTDETGVLQHAKCAVPDRRHGYCADDNARALITVVLARYVTPDDATLRDLGTRYLSFLDYAFDDATGRFRNFMTYDRRWLEQQGSEDSHGRALWALGTAVALDHNEGRRMLAADLLRRALPAQRTFRSPRAHALTVLGLHAYLEWFRDDEPAREVFLRTARELAERFRSHADDAWYWCENTLTYANAKLPHALLVAGRAAGDEAMLQTGLAALRWLCQVQRDENDCFAPVGSHGWFTRGGPKARYAQQPVEAYTAVDACLAAHDVTRDPHWYEEARRAFEWFLGRNDMLWPLYDATTGGCRDGLEAHGVNQNQGAESTLAWLLSLLRMHLHRGAWARGAAAAAAQPAAALADPPEEKPA